MRISETLKKNEEILTVLYEMGILLLRRLSRQNQESFMCAGTAGIIC